MKMLLAVIVFLIPAASYAKACQTFVAEAAAAGAAEMSEWTASEKETLVQRLRNEKASDISVPELTSVADFVRHLRLTPECPIGENRILEMEKALSYAVQQSLIHPSTNVWSGFSVDKMYPVAKSCQTFAEEASAAGAAEIIKWTYDDKHRFVERLNDEDVSNVSVDELTAMAYFVRHRPFIPDCPTSRTRIDDLEKAITYAVEHDLLQPLVPDWNGFSVSGSR